jgi:membrane-associated phospholipid phosphatase
MTDTGQPSHAKSARGSQTDAFAARRGGDDMRDPWSAPALVASPGGVAERFARALGPRHPVAIFFAALIAGIVLISALSIVLGVLVVHVLVSGLGLGSPDNGFIRTLAHHRSGTLTSVSSVGSDVGGSPVLPILVGVIGLAFAIARRWRIAAFAVFALVAESATYRITTLVIHRHRPSVHRLESLAVNASYPSGHTAASVAVYSGLVLLLTTRFTNSTFRALAWTFAILMTTFVALSRMYRGMHHPLDVAGGALVGIGAILVVLFACRAAGAAAEARGRAKARS